MEQADLIIIGAGAAGLAAGAFAGEWARGQGASAPRIVLLEGARKPGAKILISGGGRCNVTNARVTPEDYHGGPRPLVRSVLRAFDERATLAWLGRLGVALKLEPTGKYFPVSDQAATVLEALLRAVRQGGAELRAGERVRELVHAPEGAPGGGGFAISTHDASRGTQTQWRAPRVIVATGGLALPKSGSDGAGFGWLQALGHTLVPTTPALVPLLLDAAGEGPAARFAGLSGIAWDARLRLLDARGRTLAEETGAALWTHFGLSGPAPLNISRHWLRAGLQGLDGVRLVAGLPQFRDAAAAAAWWEAQARRHPRTTPARALHTLLPERLAEALADGCAGVPLGQLARAARRGLALRLVELPLPVRGDRGYSFAEATAGGIELREVDPRTMASRRVPGLFLCGEVLDVDGRIGGFNFQWAWSSGHQAGRGALAARP